jgi:hypothetical protein
MREESKRISREAKGMRFQAIQGPRFPKASQPSADFQEVQDGSKRLEVCAIR